MVFQRPPESKPIVRSYYSVGVRTDLTSNARAPLQWFTWGILFLTIIVLCGVFVFHMRMKYLAGDFSKDALKEKCGSCVGCLSCCAGWCQDRTNGVTSWWRRRSGYTVQVCVSVRPVVPLQGVRCSATRPSAPCVCCGMSCLYARRSHRCSCHAHRCTEGRTQGS